MAIEAVRAFNRFYTATIGVLDDGLLSTPYTLTEARVIFELAQRDTVEAVALRRSLGLDAGYLSRILAKFEAGGLAARDRSSADGRRQIVRLTGRGRTAYETLNVRSAERIGALIDRLSEVDRSRLVTAMATIRRLLDGSTRPAPILRAPHAGDLGWVVERHGAVYASDYAWNSSFEALCARIVADYANGHDPAREAFWIAEVGGERAGCVACTRRDDDTAQLRLLLVEPWARGAGLGKRLVDECLVFARGAGYRTIMLWTVDVLRDARRIYERAGFEFVAKDGQPGFAPGLTSQIWTRSLADPRESTLVDAHG